MIVPSPYEESVQQPIVEGISEYSMNDSLQKYFGEFSSFSEVSPHSISITTQKEFYYLIQPNNTLSYRIRPNEPLINDALHLSKDELQSIDDAYQRMCKESVKGSVAALVQRNPDGSRNTPNQVHLDIEQGVVGDRWYLDPKRDIKEQLLL